MIGYLLMAGAVLSFAGLAMAYRGSETYKAHRLFMGSAMGAATALFALALAAGGGADLRQAAGSQWIIGAAFGVINAVLIPVFLAAVARGDLSITWTLMTLSFALSSGLVLIYPGERPTAAGVAGLLLAGVAVALLGADAMRRPGAGGHAGGGPGDGRSRNGRPSGWRRAPRKGWGPLMAVTFVLNGLGLYTLSLATRPAAGPSLPNKAAYLLASGVVFAAGTLALALVKRRAGSLRLGLLFGSLAGVASGLGIFLGLLALSAGVPGYVYYPATSGGSAILVVVLSVLFLRERPGRWGWLGIAAGAVALTLIALAA